MSERGSVGGRERRLSPRYNLVLGCQISLPEEERSSVLLFPDATVAGRTRDVSESGLGVVVETIYAGYDCVVDQGRALRVSLSLPSGDIELRATAVHYVRQDSAAGESAYVIGLSITGMDDDNRARYASLLAELAGAGSKN
jgi:PilZ domain